MQQQQIEGFSPILRSVWLLDPKSRGHVGFQTKRKLKEVTPEIISKSPWIISDERLFGVYKRLETYARREQIPFSPIDSEFLFTIIRNLCFTNFFISEVNDRHFKKWGNIGNVNFFTGLEQEFVQSPPNSNLDTKVVDLFHGLFRLIDLGAVLDEVSF